MVNDDPYLGREKDVIKLRASRVQQSASAVKVIHEMSALMLRELVITGAP